MKFSYVLYKLKGQEQFCLERIGEWICGGSLMRKIEISKLSTEYDVKRLDLDDVEMIYTFCKKNTVL